MVKALKKSEIVEKTIKPAVKFLKGIKPSDKVIILHHNDPDGCCSAAIAYLVLKKFATVTTRLITSSVDEYMVNDFLFEKLDDGVTHLIVLDFPTFKTRVVKKFKKVSTLVIDHHAPVNMAGVVYCNPRVLDTDVYMPVSYLVYHIYKKMIGRGVDVEWVAATGVLGDYDIKHCKDLFRKLKKRHPKLLGRFKLNGETLYEKSLLGKIVKIIEAARIVAGDSGAGLATRVLISLGDYNPLLDGTTPETKQLLSFFEKSENELKRLADDFKSNCRRFGKMLFYEVVSPLGLKSTLATRVQKYYDSEVIVVAQKRGDVYKIGLRRGKKSTINLNSLIKSMLSEIPNSSGGGHPQAAAGTIPALYMPVFLKALGESDI